MPFVRIKSCASFCFLCLALLFAESCLGAPILPPLNNPASGEQLTGKFIWRDLATTGIEEIKSFYGKVFDWRFQAITETEDQYTLILNGNRSVAGMFSVKPKSEAKVGALWIGIMSTGDLLKAVSAVTEHAGTVHTQPTALAQRGTYALFRDPEGALFGVLKSDSGDPPDQDFVDIEIGDFLWMDLFARQPGQVAEFYRQLSGYEISKSEAMEGVERLILSSQGRPRAGIVPLPQDANRAGWLPYVRVADVAETLEKVTAAGGYVMVEPDEALLEGNLAIFADPQGGVLGVVKWVEPNLDNK
jgi:predicted enzyme related to lactoylglutathione lyase